MMYNIFKVKKERTDAVQFIRRAYISFFYLTCCILDDLLIGLMGITI